MILKDLKKEELSSLLTNISNMPLNYRNKLNIREDILFGNEIEVNNLDEEKAGMIVDILNNRYLYDSYDYFYNPEENTCDAEIATPPLNNTEFNWKLLNKAYDMIASNGAKISNNTSSHIHISSNLINTTDKLTTLLKIIYTFEDIIFKFGYGYENKPRKYILADSQPIFASLLNPEYITSYIKSLDTSKDLKNNLIHLKTHNRLDYVNFKYFNIDKFIDFKKSKDHIEFRNFNGTLYPEIAQNNINLVANIIESIIDNRINLKLLDKLYKAELFKRSDTSLIINNAVFHAYVEDFDKYNMIVNSYSNPNINKAIIFSDMIYKEDIDKLYFLKQYLKLFHRNKEFIDNITRSYTL